MYIKLFYTAIRLHFHCMGLIMLPTISWNQTKIDLFLQFLGIPCIRGDVMNPWFVFRLW